MYNVFLITHSLFRWAVLLTGVIAVARALAGWLRDRPFAPADDSAGRFYVIAMDIQLVVGLVLYAVLSPITRQAFADMGAAMRDAHTRSIVAEHAVLMVVAVVLAHVGRATSRRAATDLAKHRRAAIWYGLSLLAVLAGIPWWRPLLRV
ncbi:MAG TPA: hypothetical protein VFS05_16885 [Gemmatimonadaceae bacterium]|nr:hypothetical protein [Gemmatimonadaceae bacterium]